MNQGSESTGKKRDSINHAAEARQVGREFREIKRYDKRHRGWEKLLIPTAKVYERFENHFREEPNFQLPEELEVLKQQEYFKLNGAASVDETMPSQLEIYDMLGKLRIHKSSGVVKGPLEGLKHCRRSVKLIVWLTMFIGLVSPYQGC